MEEHITTPVASPSPKKPASQSPLHKGKVIAFSLMFIIMIGAVIAFWYMTSVSLTTNAPSEPLPQTSPEPTPLQSVRNSIPYTVLQISESDITLYNKDGEKIISSDPAITHLLNQTGNEISLETLTVGNVVEIIPGTSTTLFLSQ